MRDQIAAYPAGQTRGLFWLTYCAGAIGGQECSAEVAARDKSVCVLPESPRPPAEQPAAPPSSIPRRRRRVSRGTVAAAMLAGFLVICGTVTLVEAVTSYDAVLPEVPELLVEIPKGELKMEIHQTVMIDSVDYSFTLTRRGNFLDGNLPEPVKRKWSIKTFSSPAGQTRQFIVPLSVRTFVGEKGVRWTVVDEVANGDFAGDAGSWFMFDLEGQTNLVAVATVVNGVITDGWPPIYG